MVAYYVCNLVRSALSHILYLIVQVAARLIVAFEDRVKYYLD